MHVNTVACLGKMPTHGDFVRHRASTPTMRTLDRWVRKGLHHARKHRSSQWEAAYDEALPKRFLLWGVGTKVPNALLGVFASSRDEDGRTYPFIVACEIPKHALSPRYFAYLPPQATSFLQGAGGVVHRAVAGELSRSRLKTRIEALEADIPVKTKVPPDHKRYLQQKTLGAFLEELFGHFGSSGKYQLFSTLLNVVPPLQHCSTSRLDRGLRFPISVSTEVRPSVIAFWMGVVLRLLNYASLSLSVFWTVPSARPTPNDLHLYLGDPHPRAFFDVLVPSPSDPGGVLADTPERTTAEAALSIPDKYGNMLESESVRLWEFLQQL